MVPSFVLSSLLLSTFLLPIRDNTRPAFCVSVLLTFMIVQSQVLELVPVSSQQVLMTKYILFQMFFALLVTLYAAVGSRMVSCIKKSHIETGKSGKDGKKKYRNIVKIVDIIAFIAALALFIVYHIYLAILVFG